MSTQPLGPNPKLDELMVLVALESARESGNGYNIEVLTKHAKRATELWNERSTQMGELTEAMIEAGATLLSRFDLREHSEPGENEEWAERIYKTMRALEARTPGNEAVPDPRDLTKSHLGQAGHDRRWLSRR